MSKLKSGDIVEFIGVYDADSTVIGEVSYWMKARFGAAHCALCDLTHGVFAQKREWKDCTLALRVPFRTFHRNDAPADVLAVTPEFPVVLARTLAGITVVLDASQLEEFGGSTARFVEWLHVFLGPTNTRAREE